MRSKKELWQDILSEVGPEEFRETLLNQTLTRARRQRQMRQFNKAAMVVTLLAAVSVLLWRGESGKRGEEPTRAASIVEQISSRPLASEMIVRSVPGVVQIVSSRPSEMLLVETEPLQKDFREINDEELMRFAEGKPAALVRKGPHEAELLIVDARGQNMLPAGEQGVQQ